MIKSRQAHLRSGIAAGCPRPAAGFTLIELLIVVAIIGVLAAIAVPNFLEAQARSKVARARADIRSLATAVESYYVDHAEYPLPDDDEGEPVTDFSDLDEGFEMRTPVRLTTPVAYILALPLDPFDPRRPLENGLYIFGSKSYFAVAEDPGEYEEFIEDVFLIDGLAERTEYYLLSRGPDRDHEETIGNDDESEDTFGDDASGPALYDPTNGTSSNGDLLYLGPGPGFTYGQ